MNIQSPLGYTVELTPGTPTEFTATEGFKLPAPPGGLEPKIVQGSTMTFDGVTFVYGGNPPQQLPQFIGAIKAGWVIPTENYSGQAAAPRSANIAIRPAEGGNPMDVQKKTVVTTAQAEEREVGNIANHAAQVQEGNQQNYRRVVTAAEQEGTVVRDLGKPNKAGEWQPVDENNIGSAIRQAESVRVQPGKGISREELMAKMTPEQRAAYENEIQVRKALHGQLDTQVAVQAAPQSQVVADINSSSTGTKTADGITSTVTTGGGTETYDAGGTGAEAEVTTTIIEGIKVTNTNGPKKANGTQAPAAEGADPRRVIAKAVCADFPDNYDFDAPLRKKIARIQADYDDRFDIIKAVAAAETDAEMRAKLVEEYPSAFA